jgi:glycosyltransferase involved in cell wall biosynthesis
MKAYIASHRFLLPNTLLIPNGVDIAWYCPQDDPVARHAQMVVCVARLRYEKGVDVLIRAWRHVHKQAPEARLLLVGTGPLRDTLVQQAAMLEISESIEFAGLQHDVRSSLRRASVAVLPSRFEGMPNALLEAMACALPCVATRVSGSEELIEDGVNGLLVEPEDDEGLARALLTVLANPDLARAFGQAARATVERHYALEHMIDQYVELYTTITQQPVRPSRDDERTYEANCEAPLQPASGARDGH